MFIMSLLIAIILALFAAMVATTHFWVGMAMIALAVIMVICGMIIEIKDRG